MNADQKKTIDAIRHVDEAFCRFFGAMDITETRAASLLGALPQPAEDIPAPQGRLIAFDVSNALRRLAR